MMVVIRFPRMSLDDRNMRTVRDDLFKNLEFRGSRKLVFNFRKVESASSSALGALITLHRELTRLGWELVFCDINTQLAELFDLTKLDQIFTISPLDLDPENDEIPGSDDEPIILRFPASDRN